MNNMGQGILLPAHTIALEFGGGWASLKFLLQYSIVLRLLPSSAAIS